MSEVFYTMCDTLLNMFADPLKQVQIQHKHTDKDTFINYGGLLSSEANVNLKKGDITCVWHFR